MASRPIVEIQQFRPARNQDTGHAVQFYENDSALLEMLGQHIGGALEAGDTVVVVATQEHREGLAEELRLRDVNTAALTKAGRYFELDAAKALAKFMTGETPDQEKFEATIGALIGKAEARTKPGHRVVVFGEMVALLWSKGNRKATVRLEEMWNDLAKRHQFHLLCGYPISGFNRMEHRQLFFSICGEHSHINPAESYPANGSEKQRRRKVAGLQQKAHALEAEIQISQQRIQLLQKVAKAGTWELDIGTDAFSFSSAAAKLLGLESTANVRLEQFMGLMYYSGDREAVASHLQSAQRHRKGFATTFRVRCGEGTRVIVIEGKTFFNSGIPIMLGVLSDATPDSESNLPSRK
jgi:PAS domain-containing protein